MTSPMSPKHLNDTDAHLDALERLGQTTALELLSGLELLCGLDLVGGRRPGL